jgi:integrase
MDRARAARPRPRRESRLRAQGIRARPAEEHQDAPEPALCAAAGDRAGCGRSVAGATGDAAPFPAPRGAYLDLHNFRRRAWKPAQLAAGIEPLRRPYDLRHTFPTFALRAGISTFDLSRFMGASLTMIDRHYGHLGRDGREHAASLLDTFAGEEAPAAWTSRGRRDVVSEDS